jgi:hypothetical protein
MGTKNGITRNVPNSGQAKCAFYLDRLFEYVLEKNYSELDIINTPPIESSALAASW